jgi:hypothetical protein
MESPQQPQLGEAVSAHVSALRYTEAAPNDEVMMEQLEYLLLHSRSGSHKWCSDCTRLKKIGRHLLAPFC